MKNKVLPFVKNAVVRACVVFTAANILIYSGAYLFLKNTEYMSVGRVVSILVFSVVAGIMTAFLTTDVMNTAVRAVLHYVVTLACFIILFAVIPGGRSAGTTVMIGVVYTVFWLVPFCVWLAVRSHAEKKEKRKEEYKPSFGGK